MDHFIGISDKLCCLLFGKDPKTWFFSFGKETTHCSKVSLSLA